MDFHAFLQSCKSTYTECLRRFVTDNVSRDVLQPVLIRLDTLERSLRWAKGRILQVKDADELIPLVTAFIQQVKTALATSEGTSGYQVPLVRTGNFGRSSYLITEEQLRFLLSCGFGALQIAEILDVSESTVKRRLRRFNMPHLTYENLSNAQLDEVVQQLVGENEQIGTNAVWGRLFARGLRVQRRRVRESLIRVNPAGATYRAMSQRLQRRTYRVAGPNSLWHIDGNHKLIRWRIVIHGGICGFSRLVVFLHASDNNRSSTVFEQFVQATAAYGVPSRIRCDHGGENNSVCMFMEMYHGSERGSAIRGRSVHNQRIERLWGDLWRGTTNVYHRLFSFLENERIIDNSSELHMWALHYVYLPRINRDLDVFREGWNNHGLRTAGHQTPLQLFVQGCLQRQMQPLTAMQEIFGHGTAQQGAAAAIPTPNWPEVITVPDNQFRPSYAQMQQIQDVDILAGPIGAQAIDALQSVIRILEQ